MLTKLSEQLTTRQSARVSTEYVENLLNVGVRHLDPSSLGVCGQHTPQVVLEPGNGVL